MWIHHLGTIMLVIFALLVLAHFAAHFYIKARRHRRLKKEREMS